MQQPAKRHSLATRPTDWDPASVRVRMNLRLDGCIVPSEAEGARVSYSHVVVLDDFVDDATRRELLRFLTAPAAGAAQGGAAALQQQGAVPADRWERCTADMAGAAASWGVRQHVLEALAAGQPEAVVEVQSRLCRLYPECRITHMPSAAIQGWSASPTADSQHAAQGNGDADIPPAKLARLDDSASYAADKPPPPPPPVDCSAFLANAAVVGDTFRYHVDADPTSFPPGPWVEAYGDYFNGEPGKPRLVSLLLYLDDDWPRDWAADTLFLDGDTDTGVFVRPRPGRAVLMDQDVLHRVSPPSPAAGGRPRLSLVWKLCFLPTAAGQACCIARPEWGPPVSFGSAHHVEAVKRRLAGERRAAARQP